MAVSGPAFLLRTDPHPLQSLSVIWRALTIFSRLARVIGHFFPSVWVSFIDAVHYCRWAGLALPTEWLWEKAARGPAGRPYPWGDESPRDNKLANVLSRGTRPVGSYPRTRTPYGCEDMIGNVSEWCRMTDGEDFGHLPRDLPDAEPPTQGEKVYAAVRGSCFLRTVPLRMVASHRRRLSVTRRNQWVGFRPACFLPCRPAL